MWRRPPADFVNPLRVSPTLLRALYLLLAHCLAVLPETVLPLTYLTAGVFFLLLGHSRQLY